MSSFILVLLMLVIIASIHDLLRYNNHDFYDVMKVYPIRLMTKIFLWMLMLMYISILWGP